MSEADVESLFAPCGDIIEVRLLKKEDGKSKGIGFVKFSTESARTKALDLHESEQGGRTIKVERSTGKSDFTKNKFNNNNAGGNSYTNEKPIPDVIDSCTIFVGNMSYYSSADTIR
jgi:RNA recognition motif-containing protein